MKNSNEILGGYNPSIWKSDGSYGNAKDSFIFSFKNKDIIENYILSQIKNEYTHCAIFNQYIYGPSFGDYDLSLIGDNLDKSWCDKNGYFEKPIRETVADFSVEEYEVFQVIKKN